MQILTIEFDFLGQSTQNQSAAFKSTFNLNGEFQMYTTNTSMTKFFSNTCKLAALIFTMSAVSVSIAAEGGATKSQAEAMVKKGVIYIKANGAEKAYPEVTKKGGQFSDRDLYLVVYQLDGTVLAHGANEKMVGKNLIELKDIDGKAFVKERVELAKAKPSFWQEYKFTNPESKKIEPKIMYCERLGETAVCGGIYL